MTEYTTRGHARNTMNGHQAQVKIVTDTREKAFQIFRNIFPTCNPAFCMNEREVSV